MSKMNEISNYIGKRIKDFIDTPLKHEFIIIFEDNTALWFYIGPYAVGRVQELK